jgi:hypothetical protein
MKILSPFLMAVLIAVVAGCDGDGGGATADTEETGTVEGPKGPETVVTGSQTIPKTEGFPIFFEIYETGLIQARVEWSSGPSHLAVQIFHDYSQQGVSQVSIASPAILELQTTQDLLDDGNTWILVIDNDDMTLQVEINYTVTFTPN